MPQSGSLWGFWRSMTPQQRAATLRSFTICVVYGITSMTVSLVYKALMSSYKYDAKFIMLAAQLILALLFCGIAKKYLQSVPGLEVPDLNYEAFRKSIVPGVIFVANIVVGWYGLQMVNVPMFLAIRRTNAAFTLASEYLLLGRSASTTVIGSVSLIVMGAVIAGMDSLQSDWMGFLFTLGNNALTATAMSLTKKWSDSTGIQGFGVVLYNAIVALPLCIIGAIVAGEFSYTFDPKQFAYGTSPAFWVALFTAASLGVGMSYIVFLCTTANSPLATSVTGNAKDVAATILAAVIFRDFVPTVSSVLGIILSFAGAGFFSVAKVREAQANNQRAKATSDSAKIVEVMGNKATAGVAPSTSTSGSTGDAPRSLEEGGGQTLSVGASGGVSDGWQRGIGAEAGTRGMDSLASAKVGQAEGHGFVSGMAAGVPVVGGNGIERTASGGSGLSGDFPGADAAAVHHRRPHDPSPIVSRTGSP